jgi:hypothetical protein
MIIYKMSDRIPVEIGELRFWISPLSYGQKMDLSNCSSVVSGEQKIDGVKFASLLLKYSIKEIEGLTNFDGTEYKLSFDKECIQPIGRSW